MANTSVFTGATVSVTLSTPEGVEGQRAQAVLDAYQLISDRPGPGCPGRGEIRGQALS